MIADHRGCRHESWRSRTGGLTTAPQVGTPRRCGAACHTKSMPQSSPMVRLCGSPVEPDRPAVPLLAAPLVEAVGRDHAALEAGSAPRGLRSQVDHHSSAELESPRRGGEHGRAARTGTIAAESDHTPLRWADVEARQVDLPGRGIDVGTEQLHDLAELARGEGVPRAHRPSAARATPRPLLAGVRGFDLEAALAGGEVARPARALQQPRRPRALASLDRARSATVLCHDHAARNSPVGPPPPA